MSPVSGHAIAACYCPESNCELIGSLITHHADRLYWQQNRKGLPHVIVEIVLPERINKYCIRFAKQFKPVRSDVAYYPDSKAGSWKWVAAYERLRNTEFPANISHFILKEFPDRFNKLQVHFFGKSAYVMM